MIALILAIIVIVVVLVIGYVIYGLYQCSQGRGGLLCKGWHLADEGLDALI
jgi:hypothetical protein